MVDIQHIECKNQQITSSNHRIVPHKEIGVTESNSGVTIFTGNLQIAVSAHVQ